MILPLNPLQVPNKNILYWLLLAIGINRACSLAPDVYFDPFPFFDIRISVGYYIYAISNHCFVMILFYLLSLVTIGRLSSLMTIFFWLECASLIDFLLIYEHPIFHVGSYGVEFTDIKIIIYTILIIRWQRTI